MLNIKSNVWTIMILIFFIFIYLQISQKFYSKKHCSKYFIAKIVSSQKIEDYEYF